MGKSELEPHRNITAKDFVCTGLAYTDTLKTFHQSLPTYAATHLHKLPTNISDGLGLESIHLKDESTRFGLPSFKILGASWSIYRAICQQLDLSIDTRQDCNGLPISLEQLSQAAQKARIRLITCSEGNWGRAVAHTARLLRINATVFLREQVHESTRAKIASEGCEVRVHLGDYDDLIQAAIREAANYDSSDDGNKEKKLLVMDQSWEGYEEIPEWVAEGYGTMLKEVDEQFPASIAKDSTNEAANGNARPDLVIVSVGVGSWAHAVVSHYKAKPASPNNGKRTLVTTVEPINAACLLAALHKHDITTIPTSSTIMAGMNCGTVSQIAWPLLRDGVDLALTVSDRESHDAVVELREKCGIEAGPCGAAPYAALKKILAGDLLANRDLTAEATEDGTLRTNLKRVLLVSTEGYREYEVPSSTS